MDRITLIVSTIGPRIRNGMLDRALASVWQQKLLPDSVIVVPDHGRTGAAFTKDRGLAQVNTEWVAFLDDDDELYPQHLARLLVSAQGHNADLVYPWFDVGSGGTDPFQHEGKPFDPANPKPVPVTWLARTEVIRDVGGFTAYGEFDVEARDVDDDGHHVAEDMRIIRRLAAKGAVIHHHPERTWLWHHHASNTTGLPDRW